MASTRFWVMFCLLIVLAIILSGAPLFARPALLASKSGRIQKSGGAKTIQSMTKPKPVIKIGSAVYVLVRIGKPYIYELRQPKK